MKTLMIVFLSAFVLSSVVNAEERFNWIVPDPVLGESSQQSSGQPVKRIVKKKRKVLRKKRRVKQNPQEEIQQIAPAKVEKKVVRKYSSRPIAKKPVVVVRSKPEPEESPTITVALRSMFVSQYVIPSGMVSYNKPVIQSDVLVSHKSGFYLDLWKSSQLKKNPIGTYEVESVDENGDPYTETFKLSEMESNPGEEIEYNLGWSGPVAYGINLDGGVIYCDMLKYGRMGASEDVLYEYLKISHSVVAGFNGQIMSERYSLMKGSPYRSGTLYAAGVTRNDSIDDDELVIDSSIEVVHDTGVYGLEPGQIVRGKLGLTVKVTKGLGLILQLNHYEPLLKREGFSSKTVHSFGLNYQF